MITAIITGTKGFIGKNLLNRLKDTWSITEINEDIFDSPDWEKELHTTLGITNPDIIFHVGACSDTLEQDVNYMMTRNYEFTKVLADWCSREGKGLIYSSSAASYGTNDMYPQNLYGWSKYVAEGYVISKGGIALRYFNVYGPGEEHKGKMSSLAYQTYIKHKQNIQVKLFPGNPVRDFIYVEDVVDANIYAFKNYFLLSGEKYDVGVGEASPFEYILDTLGIPYEYTDLSSIPVGYQFYTKSKRSRWMTGWKPNYTLEQGLLKYKQYLDEKLSS